MPTGVVMFYNKVRKFGFIDTDNSDENVLFTGEYSFEHGDAVEFDRVPIGEKGPAAINIRKVENG